jgi:hypothetical protein
VSPRKPKVKRPIALTVQTAKPRPKRVNNLGIHHDDHPTWRLALLDLEHNQWGWKKISQAHLRTVLEFLQEMEKDTWKDIWNHQTGGSQRRGAKHKFIAIDKLEKQAQEGLKMLELDDASDTWFRFRLGGKSRLWGVVTDNVFYPVWWDPEHEVCKSSDQN